MNLIHFAAAPLGALYPKEQKPEAAMKPEGLWVSDEDAETSWTSWCNDESFALDRLDRAHEITLAADHNVLILGDVAAIDGFTGSYGAQLFGRLGYIDWAAVASDYDGIIITPYQWSRRMTQHTFWYYGWDCASGCIWEPSAIGSIDAVAEVPS